jgi:hypothetical protein
VGLIFWARSELVKVTSALGSGMVSDVGTTSVVVTVAVATKVDRPSAGSDDGDNLTVMALPSPLEPWARTGTLGAAAGAVVVVVAAGAVVVVAAAGAMVVVVAAAGAVVVVVTAAGSVVGELRLPVFGEPGIVAAVVGEVWPVAASAVTGAATRIAVPHTPITMVTPARAR